MKVQSIEKVLPCVADPWKLRVIAHLDEEPDLEFLSRYIDGRYSEKLGVLMVEMGCKQANIFNTGKVTVKMVDTEEECENFVNSLLAMACHKALLAGEL
ncbi:MAG: hypothetical protein ACLFMM_09330 [Methanohalobium sp.]|uniref:hypothetical protein n=1 Tax=Methanohalobium sp. TaxID=2837493 RepID=UPI003978114A